MKELSGFCWGFTRLSSLTSSPKTGSGSFGRAGWTTAWPSRHRPLFRPRSRRRSPSPSAPPPCTAPPSAPSLPAPSFPAPSPAFYDARVVRRPILVGHTGIRGSRRGAVGSPVAQATGPGAARTAASAIARSAIPRRLMSAPSVEAAAPGRPPLPQ